MAWYDDYSLHTIPRTPRRPWIAILRALKRARLLMQQARNSNPSEADEAQRIRDEIAHLRRELDARRQAHPPAPSSVVRAYHALLEQHYERLDGLDPAAFDRSINVP
jgi:hypothetical protein